MNERLEARRRELANETPEQKEERIRQMEETFRQIETRAEQQKQDFFSHFKPWYKKRIRKTYHEVGFRIGYTSHKGAFIVHLGLWSIECITNLESFYDAILNSDHDDY